MTEKTEIINKLCKACHISKTPDRYMKGSRVCRICVSKKPNRIEINKRYYDKNVDALQERSLLTYYKIKYNNDDLSMHEVNLMRLAVKVF